LKNGHNSDYKIHQYNKAFSLSGEIPGCHGDEYENGYLAECCARLALWKFTDVSDVVTASIIGAMGRMLTAML
jgi:hypothetical protein